MIKYKCTDKSGITGTVEVEGRLFVTKDKNGKDVFAGDSVKSGKRILTIVWDKCDMQWKTKQPGRNPAAEYYLPNTPLCQWAISEQFELIEDKEDAQTKEFSGHNLVDFLGVEIPFDWKE